MIVLFKKIVDKRPWGRFEQFAANEKCSVKLLYAKKGRRNSYQRHKSRSEFWHVVYGHVAVTLNGRKIRLAAGGEVTIPAGAKHRFFGVTDAVILEMIHGRFDEKDVIRLQDDFNRK